MSMFFIFQARGGLLYSIASLFRKIIYQRGGGKEVKNLVYVKKRLAPKSLKSTGFDKNFLRSDLNGLVEYWKFLNNSLFILDLKDNPASIFFAIFFHFYSTVGLNLRPLFRQNLGRKLLTVRIHWTGVFHLIQSQYY